MKNEFCMEFDAISENEGLARVVIAAFLSRIDPTIDELEDVKTAVSEAVTNAIIHAYGEKGGRVVMRARLSAENELSVEISDQGVGIADVEQAMQPLFTTGASNERSGMGFSFMEAFWISPRWRAVSEREHAYICGSDLTADRRNRSRFCRRPCGTEAAGRDLWRKGNYLSGHREEKRRQRNNYLRKTQDLCIMW